MAIKNVQQIKIFKLEWQDKSSAANSWPLQPPDKSRSRKPE